MHVAEYATIIIVIFVCTVTNDIIVKISERKRENDVL